MAFLDIARGKAAYDYAIVFRGTFASTAAVVWGTRFVKTSSGLIDGRLLEVGEITRGTSEAIGGAPPKASCTLRIANHDNAMAAYARGTFSPVATTEYQGDGFRNLSGKLWMLVRDPATGATYEEELTGTVVCHGIETDGFTVTLQMASRDDATLGESSIGPVTVQMVLDSTPDAGNTDGTYVTRDGTATDLDFDDDLIDVEFRAMRRELDKAIPFVYGATEIPLIKVSDEEEPVRRAVLFLSTVKPAIEGFDDWIGYDKTGRELTIPTEYKSAALSATVLSYQRLYRLKRTVTLGDGTTTDLWVVWYRWQALPDIKGLVVQMAAPDYYVPSVSYLGISYTPPALSTENKGPIAVLRAMARDHASQGSSALHDASFLRVGGELQALSGSCGGLYDGTVPLSKPFGDICRAFGIQPWVETDDKIHAFVGWGQDDKDQIDAGTLYHITAAEILSGWKETVPDDPPERGSAADLVTVRWTQRQRDLYPAEYLLDHLFGVASAPSAERATDEIDGTFIFPPRARAVMSSRANRLAFIARRIGFVGRAWLAVEAIGTLYLLSHPRGLGDNAGGGYPMRAVKLESISFKSDEDGCRVVMVDVESDRQTKPATLDTIDNWIATQTANGDTFQFTSGSATVVAGAGNTRKFSAADIGRHIWAFGAAAALLQRSWRITAVADPEHATIEFNAGASETVTCNASTGWASKVLIVDTQESKGSAYRPTRIRVCREDTGLFRDAVTAGFQVL